MIASMAHGPSLYVVLLSCISCRTLLFYTTIISINILSLLGWDRKEIMYDYFWEAKRFCSTSSLEQIPDTIRSFFRTGREETTKVVMLYGTYYLQGRHRYATCTFIIKKIKLYMKSFSFHSNVNNTL